MSNGNDWHWIKDVFSNKMVLLCLVLILILTPYFIAADRTLKIAILIAVGILAVIVFLLQWWDQKTTKEAQQIVIDEAPDREKELLRKYIKWGDEVIQLFDLFLKTGVVYYEVGNTVSIRTHMDRDMTKIKGKTKAGSCYTISIKVDEELKKADYLIKEGVAKKINAKEGEPFTFKLTLTKDGKVLVDNIQKIRTIGDSMM